MNVALNAELERLIEDEVNDLGSRYRFSILAGRFEAPLLRGVNRPRGEKRLDSGMRFRDRDS